MGALTDLPQDLVELADHFGIALEFWDWKGRHRPISGETLIAVLAALDVDASTPESRAAAWQEIEDRRWRRVLPPCVVLEEGEATAIDVHIPAGSGVEVWVELESGHSAPTYQVDNWQPDRKIGDQVYGEATFWTVPELPLGYHKLVAQTGDNRHEASLIVTPRFVGLPPKMRNEQVWGYNAQLYSIRSKGSWEFGDLADLADLVGLAATKHGCDYVLINPLHASEATLPMEPSPYLPASRRFVNPIYLRPEAIPEYAKLSEPARERIRKLRKKLRKRVSDDQIERDPVFAAKQAALWEVFQAGLRPPRRALFNDFRLRQGRALRDFAIWSTLSEVHGPKWRQWPREYQDVGSPQVAEFALENRERVEFFEWQQWVATTQISVAQTVAEETGMRVGVVSDLAVGVSFDSAERWMMPELFAAGVSVGAPPDQYNQAGQAWGQPPWRPDELAEQAYEPFRAMVSAALRRVGGLRIDHIIGLFRLWWVPEGLKPSQGTYVRNNHQALVGILALEAYRAQALIVGEDLGTVEPWVRQYLARRGLLGTSVLWFEYDQAGQPLPAEAWREYAMASVTTHDLPPTLGYLAADHIRLRDELGLLTEPLAEELAHASAERDTWAGVLQEAGVLSPDQADDPAEVMLAMHRYLRHSPAKVLVASLADAVGERRTQNQPGTIDEYPNWRVPLGDESGDRLWLEKIFSAELPRRLAAAMNGREDLAEPYSATGE